MTQRTIEIHVDLDTIRRQLEALSESFERVAADLRTGLAKLDTTTPTRPATDDVIGRAQWLLDSTVGERMAAGVQAEDIIAELLDRLRAERPDTTPTRPDPSVTETTR